MKFRGYAARLDSLELQPNVIYFGNIKVNLKNGESKLIGRSG